MTAARPWGGLRPRRHCADDEGRAEPLKDAAEAGEHQARDAVSPILTYPVGVVADGEPERTPAALVREVPPGVHSSPFSMPHMSAVERILLLE